MLYKEKKIYLLLYQLVAEIQWPAAMLGSGKTFLVIVPLILLLEDWEHQLKSSGTRYSVF